MRGMKKLFVAAAVTLGLIAGPVYVSAADAQTGVTVKAKIVDFKFKPGSISITAGDKVRWTNNGAATHTTTSDTLIWSSGNLAPGARFTVTFPTAGTFAYHCSIHTSMHGTIVVT